MGAEARTWWDRTGNQSSLGGGRVGKSSGEAQSSWVPELRTGASTHSRRCPFHADSPAGPHGRSQNWTQADHRPGQASDTKAHRKAAAPQLLPGCVLGEGAKPQPSLAMLTPGESPPASWETHSSENCSVPVEMTQSDTLFPTGQITIP